MINSSKEIPVVKRLDPRPKEHWENYFSDDPATTVEYITIREAIERYGDVLTPDEIEAIRKMI